jgi:hypothetical protein
MEHSTGYALIPFGSTQGALKETVLPTDAHATRWVVRGFATLFWSVWNVGYDEMAIIGQEIDTDLGRAGKAYTGKNRLMPVNPIIP